VCVLESRQQLHRNVLDVPFIQVLCGVQPCRSVTRAVTAATMCTGESAECISWRRRVFYLGPC
jgi:hypothetical protein